MYHLNPLRWVLSFQAYCSSLIRRGGSRGAFDAPVCELSQLLQSASSVLLLRCPLCLFFPQSSDYGWGAHSKSLLFASKTDVEVEGCPPEEANHSQVPGPSPMARCAPLLGGVFPPSFLTCTQSKKRKTPTCLPLVPLWKHVHTITAAILKQSIQLK